LRGRFRTQKRVLFFCAVRLLQGIARLLPRRSALAVFAGIGTLARFVDRPAVRRSLAHLEKALGDRTTCAERRTLVRRMFAMLGRNVLDLVRPGRLSLVQLAELVEFEGFENLERAAARGRGVVALSAHLGNWEILGAALAARGIEVHAIARRVFDSRSNRLLEEWRRRHGITTHSVEEGLSPLLGVLRAGGVLGVLADQDTRGAAVFAPFFGEPARTTAIPFLLAERSGAALVPMWVRLGEDGRHRVRILPALAAATGRDLKARIVDAATRWNAIAEAAILENPEQWVWFHQRWKSKAPVELRRHSHLQRPRRALPTRVRSSKGVAIAR
jgi:KDO2-lipid IV(A) lauroyltransferase